MKRGKCALGLELQLVFTTLMKPAKGIGKANERSGHFGKPLDFGKPVA